MSNGFVSGLNYVRSYLPTSEVDIHQISLPYVISRSYHLTQTGRPAIHSHYRYRNGNQLLAVRSPVQPSPEYGVGVVYRTVSRDQSVGAKFETDFFYFRGVFFIN
jgi:hypothetical protein